MAGLTAPDYVVDRALEGFGELAAGFGGVERVALGRGGVEADGYKARTLQHLNGAPAAREVGIGVGGDEELGKIPDYEDDVFDIGLDGEEFEQSVAYGSGDEKSVALGKKALVVRPKEEDGLDAKVVGKAVGVDYPEAALDSGELPPKGFGDFGEVNEAVDEAGAGDKLLQVGRDGSTCGQNHGVGDGWGGQAKPRKSPVDNGELDIGTAEMGYLLPEDTGGGGPGEEHTARAEHTGGDKLAQGGAALVDGEDVGHQAAGEVVLVGGDELHALVEGDFGLGCGVDGVYLLAIDTDGGDGSGDTQLVQPTQKVVKADCLAGVFFKAYNGQAPIVA